MTRRRGPSGMDCDERLDRELRDHVERQVADYIADGVTESEARRRVRLELGGFDQAKEQCRDVRPFQWIDELTRDIRIGFRALSRERLFALSVTLILAVGIGTSVAMFSALRAIVLRPLPYERPNELTILTTQLMLQNRPDGSSVPNMLDWRQQSRLFAGMTFFRRTTVSAVTFAGHEAPQRAQEGLVGPEFFELLGAPPLRGRVFSGREFERREPVVVLSEGLWQEQFARSETAVGRTLTIDGASHTIIGVMPATFQLPTRDTRFWRPLSLLSVWEGTRSIRDADGIEVIGRLAANVRIDEARTEMRVIAARLREAYPSNRNVDVRVLPLFDHVVGVRTRQAVWLGFAAVLSLLAIACANVGGLLTVRAARRRRELAVRSALGAGRARLVRQLLAENVSLWAVASAGGALLAHFLIRLLVGYGPAFPRLDQIRLDGIAVAAVFIGGLFVVMLCGTVPALLAARTDAATAFSVRHPSSLPRFRLQNALVVVQIAGALVLLVNAVLFAQSFLRAHGEDPGYSAENLLVVRLDLPRASYPDAAALAGFFHAAKDRIQRLPGVVAVGAMTDFFIRRNADQRVTIEGRDPEPQDNLPRLAIESVTPGYFRAAGIDLLDGREFDERDLQPGAARVFIVNETLARHFWPGESAIGKRMVGGSSARADGRWDTVVGVVKDMRREGLDVAPISSAFVPSYLRGMDMTVRASTDVSGLIAAVRSEIRAVDASLPVTHITAANSRLAERLAGRRFETQFLGVFAAIALLLSAAGLYASLAYQVALRTREIGIRTALGADRRSIVGMILGEGVRHAIIGAAVGVASAFVVTRSLQSLLYETAAVNAPSYAAAAFFVLAVAATAAWVPAARAARVSPTIALREE